MAFKGEAIVNVIPAGPVECSLTLIRNAPVVSGGGFHTCAIKQDVSLWCWGNNFYGQLGNGRSGIGEMSSIPVQVMSSGVVAVSAGGFHTCAIKQDGSLWCWGWNQYGQVGDGTWESKNSPVQIMSGVPAVSICDGAGHGCMVITDGSLWCGGHNEFGQLGDGTWETKFDILVQTMSEGAEAVFCGGVHTCAIKQDGSLGCWGANMFGQLGDGTDVNRNTPAQIMSIR
ncbi:MAG: RCC1 domain-containing protein [Candidatus Calescibacterium sp.]